MTFDRSISYLEYFGTSPFFQICWKTMCISLITRLAVLKSCTEVLHFCGELWTTQQPVPHFLLLYDEITYTFLVITKEVLVSYLNEFAAT